MKEEVLVDADKLVAAVIKTLEKIKTEAKDDKELIVEKYSAMYSNLITACRGNMFVVDTILEKVKEHYLKDTSYLIKVVNALHSQ